MINITLKDGSIKQIEKPSSVLEVATLISEGLARMALGAKVDGEIVDLNFQISDDCNLEIFTFQQEEGKDIYRHTTAHILAQAVKNIYPTCKLAIGPAIKNGFYYDFEFSSPITQDDFAKIEKEMEAIIKADLPLTKELVSKTQALAMMRSFGEDYKIEIIKELPAKTQLTVYRQGEFIDLCQGPHLLSTGKVKFFKLTQLTGAYWRGNEKNKMLTRIYGTSFDKKSDLTDYITAQEEAKKRDHNKLGRELGYFCTDENIGQGLPLLMPKGATLFSILQRFVEDEEAKRGYQLTKTPFMAKPELYKISGHWQHYRDKMFVIGDADALEKREKQELNSEKDKKTIQKKKVQEVLALRPMTCPFQYMIYKNSLKSYRDLPVRYNETSSLFRNEASGEMHGLIRIRQFTLSEGHIICTPSQLKDEFKASLDLSYFMLEKLGLKGDVTFRFSTWDEKDADTYIGTKKQWDEAQSLMKEILDSVGLEYTVGVGEAAFYGPKLDIQACNVFGKEDTIITIQVDMFLAEKFDMVYTDTDGVKKHPYIIHRSSIGCYERTMAMLIEKYAGIMPVWLAPVQVKVLSLTDRTIQHTLEAVRELQKAGIRAEADNRSEKIGYKVREAIGVDKCPFALIIGDKDAEAGVVSVRTRGENNDLGQMKLEQFIELVKDRVSKFE
ncbi:MAG: threonine--tRNA ligase [Firmicutes bacterium]|nr:threonine--tRNA ligase [Bacillota bacterium]